jgi:hypothetical protein
MYLTAKASSRLLALKMDFSALSLTEQ